MREGFHRWIGALIFKDKFGRPGKGSAVLISNNLILTAAHNIYDKEYECKRCKFQILLGRLRHSLEILLNLEWFLALPLGV
jgi:V8-like Glu-specific endopeptidase